MELLKKLTSVWGPSGCEEKVTELIKNEVAGLCDEIYTDSLGNLICRKKGCGKKVMFASHADEIGIVVTFIDEKGFLRFADVGGLYLRRSRKNGFNRGYGGVYGRAFHTERKDYLKGT